MKDVTTGIQAMTDRIVSGRLHIFRDALVEPDPELMEAHKPYCTAHEFDNYVWDRKPDGSISKEAPKKENDHGMDALRYAVMYEDKQNTDPADAGEEQLRRTVQAARASLGEPTQRTPGLGGRGSRWL
jgi:phage terminase large subunit